MALFLLFIGGRFPLHKYIVHVHTKAALSR